LTPISAQRGQKSIPIWHPITIGFAGGDVNLANYVGGNPVVFVDPWGLKYAELYAGYGAVTGGTLTAAASVGLDVATGGLNILATPYEIAAGTALGGAIGYGVGSFVDWLLEPVQMAKGGKQNIDNEYVRDVQARGIKDPCKYLKKLYDDTCDKAEKRKIKQAMKRFNCDGKDRYR